MPVEVRVDESLGHFQVSLCVRTAADCGTDVLPVEERRRRLEVCERWELGGDGPAIYGPPAATCG